MKTYKYDCDGGCICIGTKSCRVDIPNNYGDGQFTVYVYSKDERNNHIEYKNKWEWKGAVKGTKIKVYSYDCLRGDELSDKKNILCILKGRYSVYVNEGNVALVQWDKQY